MPINCLHGEGEFDHIHCVVPWPDSPPQMGQYAFLGRSVRVDGVSEQRGHQDAPELELIPTRRSRYIAVIRDPKDVLFRPTFLPKGSWAVIRRRNLVPLFLSGSRRWADPGL